MLKDPLSGLIDRQGIDKGIDLRQVERRHGQLPISNNQEDSAVDGGVALIGQCIGLDRVRRVPADVQQRRIRDIKLRNPGRELRGTSRRRRHIAIVRPYRLSRRIPFQKDLTSGVRERIRPIARNGRGTLLTNLVALMHEPDPEIPSVLSVWA